MPKYQSPALDKGLDILEYLSTQAISQSQTEISVGIGKKPNEIYRMLVNLEERGYVIKNPVSGKFKLSLKLYYLAHRHPPLYSLRTAALYPMQELSAFSMQSCHLSILNGDNILIIAQCSSPSPVSLSVEVGSQFSIFNSTSGSIFMSQLGQEEQLLYLNRLDGFTSLSKKEQSEFLDKLIDIRAKGFDVKESETTKGVVDMAVPLFIPEININCALVVTILSGQIQELLGSDKILDKIHETVNSIKKNLGLF